MKGIKTGQRIGLRAYASARPPTWSRERGYDRRRAVATPTRGAGADSRSGRRHAELTPTGGLGMHRSGHDRSQMVAAACVRARHSSAVPLRSLRMLTDVIQ